MKTFRNRVNFCTGGSLGYRIFPNKATFVSTLELHKAIKLFLYFSNRKNLVFPKGQVLVPKLKVKTVILLAYNNCYHQLSHLQPITV